MSIEGKFSPEIHPKGWGRELWIYNSEKFCGKILVFEPGKKCSWHYHNIKDEVFFLQSGRIKLTYGEVDDRSLATTIILEPGDSFHVPPGLRHQMEGLEFSELYEISTTHIESDSIRVIKGD